MPRVLAFFNIVSAAKRLNVEVTEQLIPKSFEDISFAFDLPQRLAAQKRGNQMAQRQVYCIGTLDTKREDVQLLSESVSAALAQFSPSGEDIQVVIVDVSTKGSSNEKGDGFEAFVKTEDVLLHHPDPSKRSVEALPSSRGEALSIMGDALANLLRTRYSEGSLLGAIGLGGSGGTALIAPALRSLPLGIPKVLISTVASGNAAPYIGTSDLILVPSVVDIAGLNTISRKVLPNAAAAFAGMVARSSSNDADTSKDDEDKISVGMTMFGVTTPCITAMQDELEGLGFETIVFHATGNGGRAMEELVGQGLIKGVIDVTTTEVADVIVGGVMACAETRFEETLKQQVPLVLSAGALDMVNFGPRNTVPPQFANRNLLIHNDQVTVMRTTVQESQEIARFIAKRLNKSTSPVRVLLPEKGVSLLDASGMPFEDLEARSALFETLEQTIEQTPERQVKRLPYNVNDPEFSKALVAAYLDLIPKIPTKIQQQNGSKESSNNVPLARSRKLQIPRLPRAKPGTLQNYKALLNKLWAQIEQGVPIVGAGAGTGISAKFEEQGGADLIVVYNSGRFRMAGRGSLSGLLPFKDANAVVLELASEVIPIVKHAPVLAGVCATDPFRQQSNFLRELESMGFQGVQNFPTVGLYDGIFRQNLEETGMGYGLEVEMIRQAHEMGLLTSPYVFNEAEARAMVEVGADIIVAHMGLTTSGSIGASSGKTLEQSVTLVQKIADAAREINEQIIVLCHGGPIAAPEDAEFVLKRTTGVHGFYGASSLERLPVEEAITNTVRRYKATKLNK